MISLKTILWNYFTNYFLNLIKNSVNHQLHNTQVYIKTLQKSNQSVHIFAAYFSTIKLQLSLYNEEQLIMHFFTKLWSKIRKILSNYQDLLNQQNSLVTLITHLKNNICESDTMIVKRTEKDICTRSTFNWTSHFNNQRSMKHASHK